MAEQNESVTVRRLSGGPARIGSLAGIAGRLLTVDLGAEVPEREFRRGTLVEVECSLRLYLGEIHEYRGTTLVIIVEHALDRDALETIQRVWTPPRAP